MEKHTPGPWLVDESLCLGAINNGKRHIAIANLYNSPDENFRVDREQQLANAQLIAAAPDLLAALKAILPMAVLGSERDGYCFDRKCEGCPGCQEQIKKARAAIRKAEGEL